MILGNNNNNQTPRLLSQNSHQPFYQGLGQFAAQMAQAAGPSTVPQSFASILGKSVQGFNQGYNNGLQQQLALEDIQAKRAREAELAKLGQDVSDKFFPGPIDPLLQFFLDTGDMSGFMKRQSQLAELNKPPELQETFTTVQNPYGRGGVGQQSSTTGRIVGYQGPTSPEQEKHHWVSIDGEPRYMPQGEVIAQGLPKYSGPPPTTTINMGHESSEDKEFGKILAQQYSQVQTSAANAQQTLNYLSMAEALASDPTALPSQVGNMFGRILSLSGVEVSEEDQARFAAGQAFEGIMGNILAEKLAAQKGPQTDRDADRMKETLATLGNTPEARMFLINSAQAMARRSIEKANFFELWHEDNGTFKGADKAWREDIGQMPLFGTNKNGLPIFYDEWAPLAKEANPTATDQDINMMWVKLYG